MKNRLLNVFINSHEHIQIYCIFRTWNYVCEEIRQNDSGLKRWFRLSLFVLNSTLTKCTKRVFLQIHAHFCSCRWDVMKRKTTKNEWKAEENGKEMIQTVKNGVHGASVGDSHLTWHGGLSCRGSDCCRRCCCGAVDIRWQLLAIYIYSCTGDPKWIRPYAQNFCSSWDNFCPFGFYSEEI